MLRVTSLIIVDVAEKLNTSVRASSDILQKGSTSSSMHRTGYYELFICRVTVGLLDIVNIHLRRGRLGARCDEL